MFFLFIDTSDTGDEENEHTDGKIILCVQYI